MMRALVILIILAYLWTVIMVVLFTIILARMLGHLRGGHYYKVPLCWGCRKRNKDWYL